LLSIGAFIAVLFLKPYPNQSEMKKYAIEIKWGVLFTLMMLLWMMLEKGLGWHDEQIEKHYIYTNFVAIPAIAFYVVALIDKRQNYFRGVMTYKQGFISGLIISLIVMLLSPLMQVITSLYITPHYFENVIHYVVEHNEMTQTEAEAYFNLSNYILQSTMFAPIMGVITTAIVAIFVKRKEKV
jgi:hypothetical protein